MIKNILEKMREKKKIKFSGFLSREEMKHFKKRIDKKQTLQEFAKELHELEYEEVKRKYYNKFC